MQDQTIIVLGITNSFVLNYLGIAIQHPKKNKVKHI